MVNRPWVGQEIKVWDNGISVSEKLQQLVGENHGIRLNQIAVIPQSEKLQQAVGELAFPIAFSYVPWGLKMTARRRPSSCFWLIA